MEERSSPATEEILMDMWRTDRNGNREFTGGKESWDVAALQAKQCRLFCPDVEEEWVADDERSCYNCRYRRWTAASFVCNSSRHNGN